jgi:cysteine desulfurase
MTMNKPIYLDYAATTPVAPEVIAVMQTCLGLEADFGNPHSTTHDYGFHAAAIVEKARARLAEIIHAYPTEIIYTSGATEANNLALQGLAHSYQNKGKHIISVVTEHKAVLDVLKFLETQGFEVTYLPVDAQGALDLNSLKQAIRPDTIFASIMLVNNETGLLNPIKDIAHFLHEHDVLLHVDAAQALGKIPINVREIDADLMSFSAHKIYGPKGIGALYVRAHPAIHLQSLIYGGGQEQGLRAGTLSPFLIAGFSAAATLVSQDLLNEIKRIFHLKQKFWQGIAALPKVQLNSDFDVSVPHICNVTFKGIDAESFLLNLEAKLAVAQGSACTSAHMEPSHVLLAMGLSRQDADASFRFSFGRYTTEADIEKAINTLATLLS